MGRIIALVQKGLSSLKQNGLRVTFGKSCLKVGNFFYRKKYEDIWKEAYSNACVMYQPEHEYVAFLEQQLCYEGSEKSKDFVDISVSKYNRSSQSPKIVAWYLPQYYQMEVNNKFHGRGFTEWTNSSKALPLFTGHYQPHIPYDVGYYDLLNVDTLRRQAELANIYGVYGFAFHFYWFSGLRTMEIPPKILLEHPEIDIHFCFDWATENWTSAWDGENKDVIFEQKLCDGDDEKIMDDLIPYFKDSRYIKIDGKPVFTVYRCDCFEKEHFLKFTESIRARARKEGFPGLYLMLTNRVEEFDLESWGFDALVEFPPCCVYPQSRMNPPMDFYRNPHARIDFFDIKDFIQEKRYLVPYGCNTFFRSALVGFDNSARRATSGCQIILNDTPEAFKDWLCTLLIESNSIHSPEENFVFINSWNEWAEGSHLEPDLKFGYAYLQAVKNALEESSTMHTDVIERQVSVNKRDGRENRFYILCVESMGDIVASEPIVRYLKKFDDKASVTWIVKNQYSEILEFNPNIERIIKVECLNEGDILCEKLRQDASNIIVDTHFDGRWCSRTKIRHINKNNPLVNEKTYFYFSSLLGSFCLSAGLPLIEDAPCFYMDTGKTAPNDLPEKFVVVHCLSAECTKDWDKEKWNKLVDGITSAGYSVVEIGLKPVIKGVMPMYVDKTTENDLQVIARIIERASCFIGVDSGFAHFANALGIPGIVILGRYKNFNYPMPYTGNYAKGIHSELVYAEHDFARTVPVGKVLGAFKRLMGLE